MEKQLDTHISHISGKVFNKPAFPLGFLGFRRGFWPAAPGNMELGLNCLAQTRTDTEESKPLQLPNMDLVNPELSVSVATEDDARTIRRPAGSNILGGISREPD